MAEVPTVLVIDDETMMLTIIEELLADYACTVQTCSRGDAALDWFRENHEKVGLVILDLALPGVQGEDAMRQFQELKPKLPIVVITGSDAFKRGEQLLAAGARAVLQKPFRAAKLCQVLDTVLDS